MAYHIGVIYQKKMQKCLEGFIKPENIKLSVDLPINIRHRPNSDYYARLNRLLRVDTTTDN